MRKILIILNIISLIASLIWLMTDRSLEPLVTSIGLIASLITLLYTSDKNSANQIFNVSSKNQSGGITAGIVNFEKPPRHLDENLKLQLLELLPNNSDKVKISAQIGNPEAFNFATEIKQHLIQRGFNLPGVASIMQHPPAVGQKINIENDGVKSLIIGTQE